MESKWVWTIVLVALSAAVYGGTVLATPATGFTSATLAKAQFVDLKVRARSLPAQWQAKIKTKGLSDLYVQSNVWTPGGSSGWHTHPGPSLIMVTVGTVTVYDGDDPTSTPHTYSANGANGFVDVGGGEVHTVRNESTEEARAVVVQFLPAGSVRRIDAPAPGNCPF